MRNRLLDELVCIIPGPGYHAPQAPEPPEEAVVLPFPEPETKPKPKPARGRQTRRRRTKSAHTTLREKHIVAAKILLRTGPKSVLELAMKYGKVKVSTMRTIMYILEDRGEVERAGIVRGVCGGAILWGLK